MQPTPRCHRDVTNATDNGRMTHVLDIGTDLDDLLATIGDLTADADPGTVTVDDAAERPPLVRPMAGLTTSVWYQ